jgi:TniQ
VSWGPRRLPIAVPPMPGETLDSWIEAYARRLRVCSRDLLDHIGLTGATLAHMVVTLTDREHTILRTATGVDAATLTRLTLAPWDGIAVTIDPASRTTVHPPAWRRQTGSRFCPACLRDGGRWQLWWRLPWAFACPTHACLLVDHCPGCGTRPHPHRPNARAQATVAGRCTSGLPNPAPGRSRARLCGHPLADVPTDALPTKGLVLAAQQRVDHLLAAATKTVDDGRRQICRTLGELHTLAYKSLRAIHATPAEAPRLAYTVLAECGGTVPATRGQLDSYDAHTIAVATTIATMAHRDNPTGQELLSWIIAVERQQRTPAAPGRILASWKNTSPRMTERVLTALDPHLQVHDRLAYGTASRHPRCPDATPELIRRRVASLPGLIWPEWAIRLVPATKAAHNALTGTRAGLAVMTLIPGTRLSQRQAIDLLGRCTSGSGAHTVLTHMSADQRIATLAILTDLARTLDAAPAPIDYTRRRTLFSHPTVNRRAYRDLAAVHGWRPPSPLQLRLLDDHLAVLLTGTHPHHRTPANRWNAADAWNPYTIALPDVVRDFVHERAQQLLRRHRISEPITWHPSLPQAAPWPGIDPDTIDVDMFRDAVAAHATARHGLEHISRATGLCAMHTRLYTQLVDLPMPEQQWDDLAIQSHHQVLDPAGLQHLYHDRQLSIMDIARLSLTTESVVRRALTTAGTTLLSQRPRTTPIPREWFQQHYLNTGKTLRQAAADAGVSRNTFSKYARQHNIPTGLNASAVNPFATWPTHQRPPANVEAACSGARGVEYVRQILQMPGHPTRRAAAAALGLHEQVLCHHRQHVERAAGIRIFQLASPLTPTPEGALFLRHAARALKRLDQNLSGKS